MCKKQVELGGQQKPSLHDDNMLWNKKVRRWGQRSNGREEVKKEKGRLEFHLQVDIMYTVG